jgi:hypothetical protein
MIVPLLAGLLFAAGHVIAVPVPVATPASAAESVLPANTVLAMEMIDAVASNTSKPGDVFHMRVTHTVRSGAQVLVPQGSVAVGQVVHAQKARSGGRGGELILAGRYLELPQGQVKLRSTLGEAGAASGHNHIGKSMALSFVFVPLAFTVRGDNIILPAGAVLTGRVAEDTTIQPFPSSAPAGEFAAPIPKPRNETQ